MQAVKTNQFLFYIPEWSTGVTPTMQIRRTTTTHYRTELNSVCESLRNRRRVCLASVNLTNENKYIKQIIQEDKMFMTDVFFFKLI